MDELGDTDADGLSEALGDTDVLSLADGETDALGESEALGDTDGLSDAEGE